MIVPMTDQIKYLFWIQRAPDGTGAMRQNAAAKAKHPVNRICVSVPPGLYLTEIMYEVTKNNPYMKAPKLLEMRFLRRNVPRKGVNCTTMTDKKGKLQQ
jgi:hypothetical protein